MLLSNSHPYGHEELAVSEDIDQVCYADDLIFVYWCQVLNVRDIFLFFVFTNDYYMLLFVLSSLTVFSSLLLFSSSEILLP